jgi:hypothetical protein
LHCVKFIASLEVRYPHGFSAPANAHEPFPKAAKQLSRHKVIPSFEDMEISKATSRRELDDKTGMSERSNFGLLRQLEGGGNKINYSLKNKLIADIRSRFRDPEPETQEELDALKALSYDELRELVTHLELKQQAFMTHIQKAHPFSPLQDCLQKYCEILYPDATGIMAANHASKLELEKAVAKEKPEVLPGRLPVGEPQVEDIDMCHGTVMKPYAKISDILIAALPIG